jgi:hypothetical protein
VLAALLVLAAGGVETVWAASFPINPSGRCPSCYTKHCELNDRGKPMCECDSIDEHGTVTPRFYVTHVIYNPPGKASTITYGEGSTSGTTTSSSKSFSAGVTASATFGGPALEGVGVKISGGTTWGSTSTQDLDVSVENTSSLEVAGQTTEVDHGNDQIWFLIEPVLDVTIAPPTGPAPSPRRSSGASRRIRTSSPTC